MKKYVVVSGLFLLPVAATHAELSYEQELQQSCAQVSKYAASGKVYYDKKNYPQALKMFQNQAAWSAFCFSNAEESGIRLTEKDVDTAINNTGLTYAKLNKPLWARAWFSIDPDSRTSQFNLKHLPAVKATSALSGEYVRYAGFGQWNHITVSKKNNTYQIEFEGLYMGSRSLIYGPNMGEFQTSMPLNRKQAKFQYEDCRIDLIFQNSGKNDNLIKVSQNENTSGCGFGHNVYAEGTYMKVEQH